ncbi:Endoribonuclease YbeY [Phycisphaerae bacterium RAS1]|nr:Endoribonuclease YbeY [Phycisphaerae bacterium RAS1]
MREDPRKNTRRPQGDGNIQRENDRPASGRSPRGFVLAPSGGYPAVAMPIEIHVASRLSRKRCPAALLSRVARHVAASEGFRHGELSIAVVGAAAMTRLHRETLGISEATDVLTFDLGTDARCGRLEAEIVVCADVARSQARQVGLGRSKRAPARHAQLVRTELALYVTHGILHLAGYDDHSRRRYCEMHTRENVLLEELGLGSVFGPLAR